MRILIILDPLDSLKRHKDSSIAMMEAAQTRGHQVFVAQQEDLFIQTGKVFTRATGIELTDNSSIWYTLTAYSVYNLTDFDAILMRKDPPFNMAYFYTTHLLGLAEQQGVRIFNKPNALRDFNEKLAILKFPEWIVPTVVTSQHERIRNFIDAQQDIILKPLDGMGGQSIFRLQQNDPNLNVVIETLTQHGKQPIMAQRYIPEISQGDKRILLINGQPAPYCLARIPKAGETRGNLAAGGTGIAQPLSARDQTIATALGPQLAAQGLLIVGLDVIGDYLTEINVTSPTCMREIAEQTGFNVADMAIIQLERLCGSA